MHLQRDSNDQRRLPSTPGFLDKLSSQSHCRGCNTSNKSKQRSKGATSVGHASGVDDGGGGGEFWQKSTVAPSVSQSVPVASESGKRSSPTTYGRRVPPPSSIPYSLPSTVPLHAESSLARASSRLQRNLHHSRSPSPAPVSK